MEITVRITTIASLFIGLTVGIAVGGFGSYYIAKNWPVEDFIQPHRPRVTAPSPMVFGVSESGVTALCDSNHNAWKPVSYVPIDENTLMKAWDGIQDLEPIYERSLSAKSDGLSLQPAIIERCK